MRPPGRHTEAAGVTVALCPPRRLVPPRGDALQPRLLRSGLSVAFFLTFRSSPVAEGPWCAFLGKVLEGGEKMMNAVLFMGYG